MKTVTSIHFDRQERRAIAEAKQHIRIAFPDLDQLADDSEIVRMVKGLNACDGGLVTYEILVRAQAALAELHARCIEQSERSYWENEILVRENPEVAPRATQALVTHRAGVGIIAPGADPCGVLAEAREQQLKYAQAALDIVDRALTYATPKPDDEKYEGL